MSLKFTNLPEVRASMEKRRTDMQSKLQRAGDAAKIIGIGYIRQNLYPGHGYDTGNLSDSYDRDSTVEVSGDKVDVIWTSEVEYQPYQELIYSPHLEPGLHAAEAEIRETVTKILLEGD